MHLSQWKKFALLMLVVTTSFSCASATVHPEKIDRALINSLLNNDLSTARKLLEQDANPEAILGNRMIDSAVCVAINDRSTKYLKLLIEYGASPNSFWPDTGVTRRTPLACAIQLENFEAFDYLIANGADIGIEMDPGRQGDNIVPETALKYALAFKKYPMAVELLNYYTPNEKEIEYMVYIMENSPYDQSHPWHYARVELIKWLNERVTNFNPRLAAPIPENFVPKCLRSYHDINEGLKIGTLCHRPEDLENLF